MTISFSPSAEMKEAKWQYLSYRPYAPVIRQILMCIQNSRLHHNFTSTEIHHNSCFRTAIKRFDSLCFSDNLAESSSIFILVHFHFRPEFIISPSALLSQLPQFPFTTTSLESGYEKDYIFQTRTMFCDCTKSSSLSDDISSSQPSFTWTSSHQHCWLFILADLSKRPHHCLLWSLAGLVSVNHSIIHLIFTNYASEGLPAPKPSFQAATLVNHKSPTWHPSDLLDQYCIRTPHWSANLVCYYKDTHNPQCRLYACRLP